MRKVILTAAALSLMAAGSVSAGTITGWDQSNVVTDPGPYVDYVTYNSIIYKADGTTNGRIVWKHGDVQPVGLKVVNGDDVDGSNCLMTTGYNPYDLSDKQCTDPLQSSKRAKVKNTVTAPLEVDFDVISGPTQTYRMLQKLTDATLADRWSGFTIELGTRDAAGNFVLSSNGDGLGFGDTAGNMWTTTVTSDTQLELVLSGTYAQGLAGPADKYHPEPGYFNPTERMIFSLAANENTITSTGISATYSDVFGPWVNSAGAPIAVFWDDDGDLNSDNHLMANCADSANLRHVGTHTGDDITGFACNGTWVAYRGTPAGAIPPVVGVDADLSAAMGQTVYTSITAAAEAVAAGVETNPMYMDYIEDAANLGLNFWITIDDTFVGDNMVIRYSPVAAQ